MAYVLDLAVILIFVLTVIRGYKIGLVNSVIGFVGMVAAVVLTCTFSGPIAQGIYDVFLQKPIQTAIHTTLDEYTDTAVTATLEEKLQSAEEALPTYVQTLLKKNELSLTSLADEIEEGAEAPSESIARTVSEKVIAPTVVAIVRCIVGIVLFVVLLLAFSVLAKLIRKILRITPLRKLDGLLGAVLGVLKGCLWVLLTVTIMQLAAGLSAEDSFLTEANIRESYVVSRIAERNPLYTESADT